MASWKSLASLVAVAICCPIAWAQPYTLTDTTQTGDCHQIRLNMKLTGQIRVSDASGPKNINLSANASHAFVEKTLVADKGKLKKCARLYEDAKAAITAGSDRTDKTLRKECKLQVAQREIDHLVVYCPTCALTRSELELTSEHLDTLAVVGLLPDKEVNVGDTWKVGNEVMQALCNFEGLTQQELACKLDGVEGQRAAISFSGTAQGIDLGAFVKMTITGSCQFDLDKKRIVALTWTQKDDREQGPASPATKIEATTTMTRDAVEAPATLNDVALISVPDGFDVPAAMLQLYHRDPKGRFELMVPRDWQVVAENDRHFILRLIDRGDFVCQATVSPWTKAKAGEHLSADEFQADMKKTPGWEQEQVLQAAEVPAEKGRWIYRMSAAGRMDGLKVIQSFYLVAGPNGDQAIVVFTMTEAQAEKLGTRDLSLVGSVDFPAR